MKTQVISQPSCAHCYDCYKRDVVKVCHHCGRGICDAHQGGARPGKTDDQAAVDERLSESTEFSTLGLQEEILGNSVVTHCRNCVHSMRSFKRQRTLSMVATGFGLATMAIAVGLFVTRNVKLEIAKVPGGLGLAVALVGVVAYLATSRLHRKHFLNQRPPFPLVARLRSLETKETIQGTVLLNAEGKYEVKPKQASGKLTVIQESTELDRQRLAKYRREYGVKSHSDVEIQAGFLVLRGVCSDGTIEKLPPKIELKITDAVQANTIAIRGSTRGQPFLASEEGKESRDWKNEYDYMILDRDSIGPELPVQLIPSLPMEGEQRELWLDMQIPPRAACVADALWLRNYQLELLAPQDLGDVIGATDCLWVPEGKQQKITWKKEYIEPEDEDMEPDARGASHRSFWVRFKNKIPADTVFQGHLCLTFAGTTSGLEYVTYFYPWGAEPSHADAGRIEFRTSTQVDVDFTLHSAGLPIQEMLSLTGQQTRRGVSPNSKLVTTLVDNLTSTGHYVKRCVESRPQTSRMDAHVTKRAWDLAGRYYDDLYPTDFHLALIGEEGEEVQRRADQNWLQADITVQAIVTFTGKDLDLLRQKVTAARDDLAEAKAVLKDASDPQLIAQQTEVVANREAELCKVQVAYDDVRTAHLKTRLESLSNQIEDTLNEFSGVPAPQAAGAVRDTTVEDKRARIRELEKLQIKLDEKYVSGQIPESRYDQIQARYLRELDELQRGLG